MMHYVTFMHYTDIQRCIVWLRAKCRQQMMHCVFRAKCDEKTALMRLSRRTDAEHSGRNPCVYRIEPVDPLVVRKVLNTPFTRWAIHTGTRLFFRWEVHAPLACIDCLLLCLNTVFFFSLVPSQRTGYESAFLWRIESYLRRLSDH